MTDSLIFASFQKILGKEGWINSDNSSSWQRDWLNQYGEKPIGVARPSSTSQVSEIIKICNNFAIFIVPQGGNTGLVGGSVLGSKGGIILSLDKMNAISFIDEVSGNIAVEAGVILQNLHQGLSETDFMFPIHLASEGSAQIGGLIASNAGGSHAFRYGMMQDLVLGLEVVLPDGKVWDGMRAVQKDNSGYQLRKLFCGSEGTLGIITKAILKLSPAHKQQATILLTVRNIKCLMKLLKKLRSELDEFLTSLEFFSDVGMEMALNNIPDLVFPLQDKGSYYLLVEVSSRSLHIPLEDILHEQIEWSLNSDLVVDGVMAKSEAQRKMFWRLREEIPEGQRRYGPQLKHDISVPPGCLDDFLKEANKICHKIMKDVQINAFGHLGDGNIHFNLSPPQGQKDFCNLDHEFSINLSKLALKMKGSFAAEHGIGRKKITLAKLAQSPVENSLMRKIKTSIDKNNYLNPGVIISTD